MTEYLSVRQVRALHEALLQATGGAPGIRGRDLLESAVARPRASFAGEDLYPSLPAKAAALMHSLVRNHPFVDGNKRTGIAAAELFLLANQCRLDADNQSLEDLTSAVAAGTIEQEHLRIWFEQHILEPT
jgi:death-on-curing protein